MRKSREITWKDSLRAALEKMTKINCPIKCYKTGKLFQRTNINAISAQTSLIYQ
jgi:hypothetical protein